MSQSLALRTLLSACAFLAASAPGWSQVPSQAVQRTMQTPSVSGQAIYDRACASCHNDPEATKSPALDALRRMRYQTINYALTQGKMQVQAAALSPTERTAIIEFLVGREATSDEW